MTAGHGRNEKGGFELSQLTVSWKIGAGVCDQNPVRRVREPAWAGWSHGDVLYEAKKGRAFHGPAVQGGQPYGCRRVYGPNSDLVSRPTTKSTEGCQSTWG